MLMLMLLLSHDAVAGAADAAVAVAVAVAASCFLLDAGAAKAAPDSLIVSRFPSLLLSPRLVSSQLAICCWLALLVFSCILVGVPFEFRRKVIICSRGHIDDAMDARVWIAY
uniref:IP03814p n=2 Tax=Drosophila melanogaster TaxID=7227 RepID=Q4V4B3_DROME|nr:IP03814p [Drosophila melanogaster]